MTLPPRILSLAGAAILVALLPARAAEAAPGEVAYREYCAGCHGADARGNGPVAGLLAVQPPDLRAAVRRSSEVAGPSCFLTICHVLDLDPSGVRAALGRGRSGW